MYAPAEPKIPYKNRTTKNGMYDGIKATPTPKTNCRTADQQKIFLRPNLSAKPPKTKAPNKMKSTYKKTVALEVFYVKNVSLGLLNSEFIPVSVPNM